MLKDILEVVGGLAVGIPAGDLAYGGIPAETARIGRVDQWT